MESHSTWATHSAHSRGWRVAGRISREASGKPGVVSFLCTYVSVHDHHLDRQVRLPPRSKSASLTLERRPAVIPFCHCIAMFLQKKERRGHKNERCWRTWGPLEHPTSPASAPDRPLCRVRKLRSTNGVATRSIRPLYWGCYQALVFSWKPEGANTPFLGELVTLLGERFGSLSSLLRAVLGL